MGANPEWPLLTEFFTLCLEGVWGSPFMNRFVNGHLLLRVSVIGRVRQSL